METTIDAPLSTSENDPSSFRRFKPLPKRRRTAAHNLNLNPLRSEYNPAEVTSFSFQDPQALAALADLHAKPYFSQLNAQQAIRDLFASDTADPRLLADFTGLYTNPAVTPVMAAIPDSEEPLESDYIDHLQLPANTKKRKVPGLNRAQLSASNANGSTGHAGPGLTEHGHDSPINEGALQLAAHRLLVDGPEDIDALNSTIHPIPPDPVRKTHRDSLVTQASLRQKALISARRKQLAAALEEASESDSLSLERALLARYPQLDSVFDTKSTYLRNSRKANLKQAKLRSSSKIQEKPPSGVPTCDFTFAFPSPASERYEATRLEAARLQIMFEEELARQTARAVEAAAKVAASMEPPPKNRKCASDGTRTNFPLPSRVDSDSLSGDQVLLGKSRQKKKKRSALANASNPHHLRNYIPSRLPQQPTNLSQASLATANLLSPPPLRFLSAQIPPKRRKMGDPPASDPMSTLTAPIDEWICANCEYNLLYGDDAGFRRSIRNRKKILSRRRRARERAAAAASGVAPVAPEKNILMEQSELETNTAPDSSPISNQVGVRNDRQISSADASDTLK